ncbi:MAG: acylase, partial [Halieaceae bacterium]|nr:acylase [Halieaceae bacterium]
MTKIPVLFLLTVIGMLVMGCNSAFQQSDYLHLGEKYDVVIERDHLGVPHIMGQQDADTAFGFAYAQAEDNWSLIMDTVIFYRGTAARHKGSEAAVTDFLVKWLGIWDTLDDGYATQLSEHTRHYVEAYADGLNYYAALHPKQLMRGVFPVTGKDIVAGYMLRHLLFYGFDSVMRELTSPERQRTISEAGGVVIDALPVGSNAFAVAPVYSTDGATRIAINSHQPTTGPVAWYEAHIQSKEGLNIMGGLFPGSPTIGVGFTDNLAWAATVNKPDLVDIYVLDINPDDPMQYRLDGQWQALEQRDIDIEVQVLGFIPWTVTREGLRSQHGPVMRTEHGTYAVRYAGHGEMRQVEQWLAMNKAGDFDQWRDAMRQHRFASFNFVYADKAGNTMFVHNSLTPLRIPGFDWSKYIPGDDSRLIWQTYMPFDKLPQVTNPTSGYIHSANQTPFNVTGEMDNPERENYRPEHGFPTRMTNRAHRGLALFEQLGPISESEFSLIKHDKVYAANSRAGKFIQSAIDLHLDTGTPNKYSRAQQLLREWNLSTSIDNRQAALGACLIGAEWL